MGDKRRFSRVDYQAPATYARKGDSTQRACETKDIGLGGLFLTSADAETFGTEVEVQLFHGADALTLRGVVRWLAPGGFGVQFGMLGARETHAITELVRIAGGH